MEAETEKMCLAYTGMSMMQGTSYEVKQEMRTKQLWYLCAQKRDRLLLQFSNRETFQGMCSILCVLSI